MNEFNMIGEWSCRYMYDQDKISIHKIVFKPKLNGIIAESVPQEDQSHLSMELKYDSDNNVLTGTWQEISSLKGPYKGQIFHGALQLIPNAEGTKAEGLWVGFSSKRDLVNSDEWVIEKTV